MKRSVLKRRTPLRSTFRHDDDREERLRVKRELKSDLDDVWSGFAVPPRDPVGDDPWSGIDRSVEVEHRDGITFAVQSPAFGSRRARKKRTKYSQRERFPVYMGWVKAQPCLMTAHGGCSGVVEADHAGTRGIGQKAHDNTCIPLCTQHHRERHDFSGAFKAFRQEDMRRWLKNAIAVTQASARRAGVEVPQ